MILRRSMLNPEQFPCINRCGLKKNNLRLFFEESLYRRGWNAKILDYHYLYKQRKDLD
ncbi:MAG: hypothetical protein J5I91_03625 [Bacteroidetes bacterium]|nr:hypothetical protein [Bacteroidota bacterium]